MGLLDGINSTQLEKGWQCLLRDNHIMTFRRLDLEDSCLIERNKDKTVFRGWKDLHGTHFPFPGYKPAHLPPCEVTFCHLRDVVYEIIPGIVPDHDKPDAGRHRNLEKQMEKGGRVRSFMNDARMSDIRQWCADVGEQRRMKLIQRKPKQPNLEKIVLFLGIGFVMELLMIFWQISQRHLKL